MFLIISLALLPVLLAQKEFTVDVDCTKEPARSSHENCKSNRRRQSGKILFHETDHAVDAGERIAAEIRKQLVKEFGLRADVDCTKEPARSSRKGCLILIGNQCLKRGLSFDVDCTKEPARSSHKECLVLIGIECLRLRRGRSSDVDSISTQEPDSISTQEPDLSTHEECLRGRPSADVDCTKEPARSSHEDFKSIRERRSGKILFHENCTYILVSVNSCSSVFDCADDEACVGANANTSGTCQ